MINAAKRLDRNGFLEHILTYNMKMYVVKVTNVITQVHINIPFHINVINVAKRLDRNRFLKCILNYNMKMYVIKVTNVITQVHINKI